VSNPTKKEDLERLAQYTIRNPFSVEKMHPDPETGAIIYRSGMNPKIRRNVEFFFKIHAQENARSRLKLPANAKSCTQKERLVEVEIVEPARLFT
jgi:hypothetical protein